MIFDHDPFGMRALALAAILALTASGVASAADGPKLRQGRWHFERTMEAAGAEPKKIETTQCIDPNADQKRQVEMLTKAGCTFEPVVQGDGNVPSTQGNHAALDRQAREDPVVQLSVEILEGRVEGVLPRNRREG